jgi:hypothetical protein
MANLQRARLTSNDVGTLWTMHRDHRAARCALIKMADGWEVLVLVSNRILLSQVCDRAEDAFGIGSEWRREMTNEGWRQVIPVTL